MKTNQLENIVIESIGGKSVHIFEDHATALAAWSEIRRSTDIKPNLITLDTHTDTNGTFNRHLSYIHNYQISREEEIEQRLELCRQIDFRNASSVDAAIKKLANDEHIDAAVKAGIINAAFVISYLGVGNVRSVEESTFQKERSEHFKIEKDGNYLIYKIPMSFDAPADTLTYIAPPNRIFEIPNYIGFKTEMVTEDIAEERERKRRHSDLAIETSYLTEKLKIARRMAHSIGISDLVSDDYILDIDLDYFRTAKAIKPEDPTMFYKLIRGASAITVALEPKFVIDEQLNGEMLTSEFLLSQLIAHIKTAFNFEF